MSQDNVFLDEYLTGANFSRPTINFISNRLACIGIYLFRLSYIYVLPTFYNIHNRCMVNAVHNMCTNHSNHHDSMIPNASGLRVQYIPTLVDLAITWSTYSL